MPNRAIVLSGEYNLPEAALEQSTITQQVTAMTLVPYPPECFQQRLGIRVHAQAIDFHAVHRIQTRNG